MGVMTHAETSARPPRRALRGDARFLLGILLIAASVAGVWFVVAAARQTAPAYAAARTIVPGQVVAADDLRQVDVALGQSAAVYLAPGGWREGMVSTRTVEAGELVPADAVGDADRMRTTNVVVPSSVDVPASVDAGAVVEVWAAPPQEDGGFEDPRILVADATVVSVTRDDSMMGGGAAALELVIPRAEVAVTLAALADGAVMSVVPTVGGGE
jgi:hypothetical protein